jgi:hypothetical protein
MNPRPDDRVTRPTPARPKVAEQRARAFLPLLAFVKAPHQTDEPQRHEDTKTKHGTEDRHPPLCLCVFVVNPPVGSEFLQFNLSQ